MRRYDIVSRILFILAITDFALAAPVSVQEKRQPCVDIMQMPNDVTAVLGKRAGEQAGEIEKELKKFFETWQAPVESSDAHASPRPDGSANVVQVPTANPGPLVESPGPPSTASIQGDDELHRALQLPALTWHGSDHELTGVDAPQPNTNKEPTGPDPDLDFDWDHWWKQVNPPPKRPKVSEVVQQPKQGSIDWRVMIYNPKPLSSVAPPKLSDHEVEHFQRPSPASSTNSEYEGLNLEDLLPPSLVSMEGSDQAHEFQVLDWPPLLHPSLVPPEVLGQAHRDPVEHTFLGPSTEPEYDAVNPPSPNLEQKEPEIMVEPPSTPESADPEDHPSLSTGIQPEDLLAAVHAAKGKVDPVSTWEVGSTSQSKSPPARRSLDPGE